jgi:hypothetical protein
MILVILFMTILAVRSDGSVRSTNWMYYSAPKESCKAGGTLDPPKEDKSQAIVMTEEEMILDKMDMVSEYWNKGMYGAAINGITSLGPDLGNRVLFDQLILHLTPGKIGNVNDVARIVGEMKARCLKLNYKEDKENLIVSELLKYGRIDLLRDIYDLIPKKDGMRIRFLSDIKAFFAIQGKIVSEGTLNHIVESIIKFSSVLRRRDRYIDIDKILKIRSESSDCAHITLLMLMEIEKDEGYYGRFAFVRNRPKPYADTILKIRKRICKEDNIHKFNLRVLLCALRLGDELFINKYLDCMTANEEKLLYGHDLSLDTYLIEEVMGKKNREKLSERLKKLMISEDTGRNEYDQQRMWYCYRRAKDTLSSASLALSSHRQGRWIIYPHFQREGISKYMVKTLVENGDIDAIKCLKRMITKDTFGYFFEDVFRTGVERFLHNVPLCAFTLEDIAILKKHPGCISQSKYTKDVFEMLKKYLCTSKMLCCELRHVGTFRSKAIKLWGPPVTNL